MALSDADAARLASLESARDKLITGTGVVRVSTAGRSVEYSQGNLGRLEDEIAALKAKDPSCTPRRGALGFRIV